MVFTSFKDENAVGDWVSRDAYSAFFESVYSKMEGHFEKFPSTCLEEDELNILGRVMTHAFILFDVFPVALCKVSMKKLYLGKLIIPNYWLLLCNSFHQEK